MVLAVIAEGVVAVTAMKVEVEVWLFIELSEQKGGGGLML